MDTEKLNEAIASMLKDKSKREALAQMFVEFAQPSHVVPDFISMLLKTRSLKPGDSLVKRVRKGGEVHTWVPGSITLSHEITVADRINYAIDGAIIKMGFNTWDLENGDIGTVDEIRGEMLAKLKDYYQNKVFTALSTVWSAANTPSNYIAVGGALTSTVLKNAIDYINQNSGRVKAVVGLRSLLTPITTFGNFWSDGSANFAVDPQLNEVMQTGWLGKYYGAPIIALDQVYDYPDTRNTLLPTDKILVLADNVGEFITYGDVKSQMYDDPEPTPPYTYLSFYQQFSLMVDNAQGIYVIGNLS